MSRDCVCDCCVGVQPATPQPVANRPGLPEVAYRAGEHDHFKASLRAGLTCSDRPALAELSTRADNDVTIALLDATACLADIITFYNERLINEAYLRTAADRWSIVELGKLVAYRARPGVAAGTHLVFHVEPPPPPEVDAAAGPFRKMAAPAAVTIPAGVAVRSIPGPGEQPQVFETSTPIAARPQWNLMSPVATRQQMLGGNPILQQVHGSKPVLAEMFLATPPPDAALAAVSAPLKPGDTLLFIDESKKKVEWEMRTVAAVEPDTKRQRTKVSWLGRLTVPGPLTPYVMRKRCNVFGYNAPLWKSMSKEFKRSYPGGVEKEGNFFGMDEVFAPKWPNFLMTSPKAGFCVDLDGSHPEAGSGRVILSAGADRRLFTVASVVELSRAAFAISGKVTRLKLDGDPADPGFVADWKTFRNRPRKITVHAVEERLPLADLPVPETARITGNQIIVSGNVTDLAAGRTLFVTEVDDTGNPTGDGEIVTVASAGPHTANPENTTVTLTGNLRYRYRPAATRVFGNVVAATHGETVHQILGNGDAATPWQRFDLKHAPLTHVPSEDPSGVSSTLEVRVNDVTWHEKPTLFGAGPGERVFVTAASSAQTLQMLTGDGRRGARLPSGQHNVRATYRKGLGVAGNLNAGVLTQLAAPPLGVTGVTNPVPAVGGADPDSADHARRGVPMSTRTLGRAVSLTDYADFAASFAGIAKSHAGVLSVANVRTIVVTVAAEHGKPVPGAVCARLVAALRRHGDPLAPVVVVAHRDIRFRVEAKLRRDPNHHVDTVRAAVAARLTEMFSFAAREFTQPVLRSAVIAAIQAVPGVVGVDLDGLSTGRTGDADQRLLAAGPGVDKGVLRGAELLVLDADPLKGLVEMP